jgi:NADH dehydrogenase
LLVNLGGYRGVGRLWRLPLGGFPGWLAARGYHLLAMPTWSRRVRVALDWAVGLVLPRVDIADLTELSRSRKGG